jgi:ubiquinone/menaquinone biosynthesis C-methylase UbiE
MWLSYVADMSDYLASTIQSYDNTAEAYAKNVAPLHPYDMSDKFVELLTEDSLVLDMGCGSGRDAKVFLEHGCRVVGIDLSEKMVSYAQKHVKEAEFKVMDLRQLDFDDEHFDGLWASASYLHISKADLENALKEAHRVLKSGGIFYLSVKEGDGEECKQDKRFSNYEKFWSYYRQKEINDALEAQGFDIVFCEIEKQNSAYATHPFVHIICKKIIL